MRFLLAGALVGSVSAQYTNVGCPDVTGDGTVNVEDLLQLLSGYAKDASGDVTGDGVTNVEVRALPWFFALTVCCVLVWRPLLTEPATTASPRRALAWTAPLTAHSPVFRDWVLC